MQTLRSIAAVRALVQQYRIAGESVGFVPTMGHLHPGHQQLVRQAMQQVDRVIVSVFVNPTQFEPGEDFHQYPRTPEADSRCLIELGCDCLFYPEVDSLYPQDGLPHINMHLPKQLTDCLCGMLRKNHFSAVATIVLKLLNIVQPDQVFLGKKDYQQLCIIRKLLKDSCLPIQLVPVDTVRLPTGLAYSSRNHYLSEAGKQQAASLYASLKMAHQAVIAGQLSHTEVKARACDWLKEKRFEPEYFDIRVASTLKQACQKDRELLIAVAARFEDVRLIDNIEVDLPSS